MKIIIFVFFVVSLISSESAVARNGSSGVGNGRVLIVEGVSAIDLNIKVDKQQIIDLNNNEAIMLIKEVSLSEAEQLKKEMVYSFLGSASGWEKPNKFEENKPNEWLICKKKCFLMIPKTNRNSKITEILGSLRNE